MFPTNINAGRSVEKPGCCTEVSLGGVNHTTMYNNETAQWHENALNVAQRVHRIPFLETPDCSIPGRLGQADPWALLNRAQVTDRRRRGLQTPALYSSQKRVLILLSDTNMVRRDSCQLVKGTDYRSRRVQPRRTQLTVSFRWELPLLIGQECPASPDGRMSVTRSIEEDETEYGYEMGTNYVICDRDGITDEPQTRPVCGAERPAVILKTYIREVPSTQPTKLHGPIHPYPPRRAEMCGTRYSELVHCPECRQDLDRLSNIRFCQSLGTEDAFLEFNDPLARNRYDYI
ncbi:hypothetical protein Bbelb_204550 [Branchiostoma belcheri]|nr:hypothetical protein Bbelb_204550 [Branchiostoma belcheri]